MKQKFDSVKKVISQYRKAFVRSSFNAGLAAVTFSHLYAIDRLMSLEIGEYPEEPAGLILARLREMRPVVIRDALVRFLLLLIIFFCINIVYWFKRQYNINLLRKLVTEVFKNRRRRKA